MRSVVIKNAVSRRLLMLVGHITEEGQRVDTINGRSVWTLMSDYQDLVNGGDGWLRLYEFSPTNNVICVRTYSRKLAKFETDANSHFEIPYNMELPVKNRRMADYAGK